MTTKIKTRSDLRLELIQHMGSDELVARAARTSTGKDQLNTDKIEGLIRYLVKNRHDSPLDHCVITLRVEAPMPVRDQWVRHRSQSYSIRSLRFSEASPEFYQPPQHRPLQNDGSGAHPKLVHSDNDAIQRKMGLGIRQQAYKSAWRHYQELLEIGWAEEIARDVLPAGIYTTFYATANLRNWLQFCDLRIASEGNAPQWEIMVLAEEVWAELITLFPIAVGNWKEYRSQW